MDSLQHVSTEMTFAIVLVPCAVLLVLRFLTSSSKANVPVVGNDGFFGYRTAFKILKSGTLRNYLFEGYNKNKTSAFQVPGPRSWTVFVAGDKIHDVRKAKDDVLSFKEEINDNVSMEYTMGKAVADEPWHVAIVRKQLTSNLGAVFRDIYDEISQAFEDEIGPVGDEWKAVPAFNAVVHIVCRASNRLFVGLPYCRDKHFTEISTSYTMTIAVAGFYISLFPEFLKPFVARFMTKAPAATKEFENFTFPIIAERRRLEAENPQEWKERKPNDFLQWMIDYAGDDPKHSDPKNLNVRMLSMNFAALNTTSNSFTQVLYFLGANPQFAPELREEVEAAIAEHGWTKEAFNGMIKLDSFIKECLRLTGIGAVSVTRKVVKPFKFSDGTVLQPGSHVAANLWSVHHDPSIYPDPDKFDPFRFSRRVESEPDSLVRNALTTANGDYLLWGYGGHVCAGRYFASQELKTMLAHTLMHYDVRTEQEGVRPPDKWFMERCMADREARVLFRRRQHN